MSLTKGYQRWYISLPPVFFPLKTCPEETYWKIGYWHYLNECFKAPGRLSAPSGSLKIRGQLMKSLAEAVYPQWARKHRKWRVTCEVNPRSLAELFWQLVGGNFNHLQWSFKVLLSFCWNSAIQGRAICILGKLTTRFCVYSHRLLLDNMSLEGRNSLYQQNQLGLGIHSGKHDGCNRSMTRIFRRSPTSPTRLTMTKVNWLTLRAHKTPTRCKHKTGLKDLAPFQSRWVGWVEEWGEPGGWGVQ